MPRHYLLLIFLFVVCASVQANPIQFINNNGQITDQHYQVRTDVDAKIEANGVALFVGDGQLHYQWCRSKDSSVEAYRMDVALLNANTDAEVIFEEATGYQENYYLAHTGEHGVHANGYEKVIYKNIYPNIDWVLYVKNKQVKYDFVVHKGGNPADVQLQYDGATNLKLVEGVLVATTPFGSITEAAPYSYLEGTGTVVASAYKLQQNVLSFDVAPADGTVVIDPTLSWATYYGGTGRERGRTEALAIDTADNIYMAGTTASASNIATSGAHMSVLAGDNVYIAKFTPAGVRLWGTYYGGDGGERFGAITADNYGDVYIYGTTSSDTGIATQGAFIDTKSFSAGGQGFLAKFSASGQRIWATYLMCNKTGNVNLGEYADVGGYLAYSSFDNAVYIGSSAVDSFSVPTTGAHMSARQNGWDGVLMKFNASGQRIWGTYYAGIISALACDASGNVYSAGRGDTAGIATTGCHQSTYNNTPARYTAHIAKFNANGVRQWGTYYGGNGTYISDMVCDASNNLYLVGGTNNGTAGLFTTTGAHQTAKSGGVDGILAKFNTSGVRQWGTYYGGNGDDHFYGITLTPKGKIYVVGTTSSTTGIATAGAPKTTLTGTRDGVVAAFENTGNNILWGTYHGGNLHDDGESIAYGNNGVFYVSGTTGSTSGVATNGAHKSSFSPSNVFDSDQFLSKFGVDDTTVYLVTPLQDTLLCTGDTLHLSYGTTKQFQSNNIFTVQLSNAAGSFSSPTILDTIQSNIGGNRSIVIGSSIPDGSGYRVRIISSNPVDTSNFNGYGLKIYHYPANFTAGSNSPICSGDSLKLNSSTSTSGITYSWTGPNSFAAPVEDTFIANTTMAANGSYYITIDNNGCMIKDTLAVTVNQTPQNVVANNNSPVCTGDTLKLTSGSANTGVTYSWTGPKSYGGQNVTLPSAQLNDSGTYTLTAVLGSCSATATTKVSVDQSPIVSIVPSPGTTICQDNTVTLTAFVQHAGSSPQLQWRRNGSNISGATGSVFKTSSLQTGDKFALYLIPSSTCPAPMLSNEVAMTVLPLLTPQVSITANPNHTLFPNEPVTFTATPTDAGNNPTYQWTRNGTPVGGATGAQWGANANFMSDGDEICAIVYSDYACPSPDSAKSNCITVKINVGVSNISKDSDINIYPNPVTNELHIDGATKGTEITLYDVTGRTVYRNTITTNTHHINTRQLSAGSYVLVLTDKDGKRLQAKVNKW